MDGSYAESMNDARSPFASARAYVEGTERPPRPMHSELRPVTGMSVRVRHRFSVRSVRPVRPQRPPRPMHSQRRSVRAASAPSDALARRASAPSDALGAPSGDRHVRPPSASATASARGHGAAPRPPAS